MDSGTHRLQFVGISQNLIIDNEVLQLQEIFGLEDAKDEEDESSDMHLCTICITEKKNTVVMPCGHLCVCKNCAIEFSKAKAPACPVCWKVIMSFVPLNLDTLKKLSGAPPEDTMGIVPAEEISK